MNYLKIDIWLKWCTSFSPTILQKVKKIFRDALEKSPKNVIFWHWYRIISGLRTLFKNPALSLFYIHSILHLCKILEKSLERFLKKGITDCRTHKITCLVNFGSKMIWTKPIPISKIRYQQNTRWWIWKTSQKKWPFS